MLKENTSSIKFELNLNPGPDPPGGNLTTQLGLIPVGFKSIEIAKKVFVTFDTFFMPT